MNLVCGLNISNVPSLLLIRYIMVLNVSVKKGVSVPELQKQKVKSFILRPRIHWVNMTINYVCYIRTGCGRLYRF